MDTSSLTTEERIILRQLAESPGWSLLMERLFIPEIQHATAQLDLPRIDQSGFADIVRGEKRATMRHLNFVYTAAGVANPLEVHALGLLKAVARTQDAMKAPVVLHVPSLQGEALCGKAGERIADSPLDANCPTCQQMRDMRSRRGRNTFPV